MSFASPVVQTETLNASSVEETVQRFSDRFENGTSEERKTSYTSLVNEYYDIVTTFYEWGWGECFHFSRMFHGESRTQGIARHEHFLASAIGLKKGMRVLDVGCGIGGPARQMARFSGATVVGINNNAYQISRGKIYDSKAGLADQVSYVKGDFLHMPEPDNSFDAVYSIEATCHAPDKRAIYGEIFRVLKPGGMYGGYEWVMTDKFDESNEQHQKIKHDIMIGDGLPDIDTTQETLQAMRDVGFEFVECLDLANDEASKRANPVPWYSPLAPGWNPSNFKSTGPGRLLTLGLCSAMERLGLAPKGTAHTQKILMQAADGLVEGGRLEIFTPMLFMLVRKPLSSSPTTSADASATTAADTT